MSEIDRPAKPERYADALLGAELRQDRADYSVRAGDAFKSFTYPVLRWALISVLLWAVFDVITSPVDLFLYIVPLACLDMLICFVRSHR